MFFLVDALTIDFDKFAGIYGTNSYETEEMVCYPSLHDGETICRRELSHSLALIARFEPNTGTGDDLSWDFANDQRVRDAYIERFRAVLDGLQPTGRSVEVDPFVIRYDGSDDEVLLRISGVAPDEFVDVEVGVPPTASAGGICPKIFEAACDLMATSGGRADDNGFLEVVLDWRPCNLLAGGVQLRDLAGDYPVAVASRDSHFLAITAFQVRIETGAAPPSC
jgi:hypothetical protein